MVEHTPTSIAAEIVNLINSRVTSPRHDELVAIIGKLVPPSAAFAPAIDTAAVERAIAAIEVANAAVKPGGEASDAETDEVDRCYGVLDKLIEPVWRAPSSSSGLRAAALVAKHWLTPLCVDDATGEKWRGTWRQPNDCDDYGERVIAELIDAVLQATEPSPVTSDLAASMANLERWRRALAAQHAAFSLPDGPLRSAAHNKHEAAIDSALESVMREARMLAALPVRNSVDVLLLAEIAVECNSAGNVGSHYPECVIDGSEGGGSIDDVTLAHLVKAVFDVLGAEPPRQPPQCQ